MVLMPAELTIDGVHPNATGYAFLAPTVERALVRDGGGQSKGVAANQVHFQW